MMREKQTCPHGPESLCSCKPLKEREKDIAGFLRHISENMTNEVWELDYTDINRPEKRRLCVVGTCRLCGGRLCYEMDAAEALAGNDFLAAVYHRLYELHRSGGCFMGDSAFRVRFVELFHTQDQPLIRKWLEQPENRAAQSARCRDSEILYTILHTSADADQGHFPPPTGMGTFFDLELARKELKRLAEKEKKILEISLSAGESREEYGDDFWEAYQEGYAAGWYTRYEILESPLHWGSSEKKGE